MQNIMFKILKYVALAAAIYLIFRFIPNNSMSSIQILITTSIILIVYIIFDSLFSISSCNNNTNNLSSSDTAKLCSTVCNPPRENMCNVNNSSKYQPEEYNNSIPDEKNINVNVNINEEDGEDESNDNNDNNDSSQSNDMQLGYDESGFIYNNFMNNYYDSENYMHHGMPNKKNIYLQEEHDYIDLRKKNINHNHNQNKNQNMNQNKNQNNKHKKLKKYGNRIYPQNNPQCPPCPVCPIIPNLSLQYDPLRS